MKSGEDKISADNLRTFTSISAMDGRIGWDQDQRASLIQGMADSEKVSFAGCLADTFGLEDPKIFSVGPLVRIIALPNPIHMENLSEDIKTFASYYGYAAVISGHGIFGAEIIFINHGALALATAVEALAKLNLLS
ncbi:hypothetical protein [Pseudomonas graminis]|uniref:Uncharacterized protein n=1 Tax=Pseudomonas graminis TaxID=158627 RepID=A0A6M8MRH8_9PSED|nr:hypothetical protein [Pseudomonas graminis]QKF52812.1 hypothetical protein FX982_03804 [Pseudomonas graminis]